MIEVFTDYRDAYNFILKIGYGEEDILKCEEKTYKFGSVLRLPFYTIIVCRPNLRFKYSRNGSSKILDFDYAIKYNLTKVMVLEMIEAEKSIYFNDYYAYIEII